jgi:VWFA-related protein
MARVSRTSRRRRVSVVATLLLSACSLAALADQQQPAGTDGDPSRVRIDAVVTDAQGRPILDLHPSDFELLENGVAKPLDAVEFHALPRAAGDVTAIENEADEPRAAKEPDTRVFAFFLDEFHVSSGLSTDRVRRAMTEFVDEKLRPQDLAIVMKPLDSVNAIRFTRDHALLHGAIDGFTGRKGDYAPRTRFEELYIGRAPGAVVAARRQIVTAGLREITMRLGELNANRAAIVFVSEGFPRDIPGQRGRPDLQGVVRASSPFHLATYTINPTAAAEDAAPPAERERSVAMLQWLASQTGGRAVEADALVAGLARLSHDLDAYYALTYQPAQADGRFHAVEVRALRRDVVVHTRPGYWSPLGSEWRAMLASSSTTMPALSRRPLRRSNAIDTWVGIVRDTDGRARMVITWEPRSHGVSAPQVIALKARTTAGTALFDGRLGRVGSGSLVPSDSARFDVPTGRVEIDMTIYDAEGKAVDTDARDFDVPDLRSQQRGPVLLSPEVVRARTLRDFRSASTDPDAAPSSVRTFARGDRLLIRVPAFDASGTAVLVTAKVLNEWGQPMRDIDPLDATPRDGMPQFSLPLSWLVPGDYLIEVMGTNANGAVKERVAFKVTG